MNEAIVKSPLPKNIHIPVGMDFPSAMQRLIEGKKITRPIWPKGEYGFFNDRFVSLHKVDNINYRWNIIDEDIYSKDFVIYEP